MNTLMFVKLFKDHFDHIEISPAKIKRSEKDKEVFEEEIKEEKWNYNYPITIVIVIILGILIYKKFF